MIANNEVCDFMKLHGDCPDGFAWAMTQASMSDVFKNCERGDWLMWVLRKHEALDKPTSVKLACEFALRVLLIYEKKHFRKEPRLAIEAALRWVESQTQENAYADANASYADANAANAVANAANAARKEEQKAQCVIIRSIVKNPWAKI